MIFEVGKYYKHDKGRAVSVVGQVTTKSWGHMVVLEETDRTGAAMSCVALSELDKACAENWIEIGPEEWAREYKRA